jgi:predicted HTH transcriptional regulator
LPLGLSQEAFFKGKSLPRNREIMRIFSNMELAEQLGSGMHRIMKYYKPEDYIIDDAFIVARFKYNEHALTVFKNQKSTEKVRRKYGESTEKQVVLSTTKKRIIDLISTDCTITINNLATTIGVSTSTIEKNIKQLKNTGFLERKNGDKGGYWEIKTFSILP